MKIHVQSLHKNRLFAGWGIGHNLMINIRDCNAYFTLMIFRLET